MFGIFFYFISTLTYLLYKITLLNLQYTIYILAILVAYNSILLATLQVTLTDKCTIFYQNAIKYLHCFSLFIIMLKINYKFIYRYLTMY